MNHDNCTEEPLTAEKLRKVFALLEQQTWNKPLEYKMVISLKHLTWWADKMCDGEMVDIISSRDDVVIIDDEPKGKE